MIYLWRYFNKQIQTFLLLGILGMWALTSTYIALTKKNEVLLIQGTGFDTRVLGATEEVPTEIINFFHDFSGLFYTYSSESFEERMNKVVPFFEIEVMRGFQENINNMFEKLEGQKVSQFTYIQEIKRIRDLDFEIRISVEKREEFNLSKNNYLLKTSIARVQRSKSNPYGIKITRLEEIHE